MIRKVISTFTVLLFCISVTAFAQINVGYMNIQEVLSQLPEREQVEQQLNSLIEEKQQELEQRASNFQNAVAQYQQNQASLSDQQRQAREEELTEMEDSLTEYQQSIQVEVQQRRAELLQPIYDRMDKAIAVIAEDMDLDFVLNESTNMGDNIIYFSSQEQLDITPKVIDQLNN